MTDNKQNRGNPDRNLISFKQKYEFDYAVKQLQKQVLDTTRLRAIRREASKCAKLRIGLQAWIVRPIKKIEQALGVRRARIKCWQRGFSGDLEPGKYSGFTAKRSNGTIPSRQDALDVTIAFVQRDKMSYVDSDRLIAVNRVRVGSCRIAPTIVLRPPLVVNFIGT
jgi:hypothetical protein